MSSKQIPDSTIKNVEEDLLHIPSELAVIRSVLNDEYVKEHSFPWIVAYSGGKDSTLLLQLVFETVLALPTEERKRPVYVVGNDTLVESPLVIQHLRQSMEAISHATMTLDLPILVKTTTPCIDQTFWANLIGRGYGTPTRNFRWCTDRMKIRPTSRFIKKITSENKKSILLVGTRKSESSSRRRRMEQYERHGRMNPHNQISNCLIFSPIAELTDNEVWAILLQSTPPWGGSHQDLITLYRNAGGGECPLVLSKADEPSCGSSSPRFGCWTCTVVKKDRSLKGLVDSGYEEFEPLMEFRDWIIALREDEQNRMPVRRDGTTKYHKDGSGSRVRGPFKMEVRRHILDRLLELEKETGKALISKAELEVIYEIWRRDGIDYETRDALLHSVGAVSVV